MDAACNSRKLHHNYETLFQNITAYFLQKINCKIKLRPLDPRKIKLKWIVPKNQPTVNLLTTCPWSWMELKYIDGTKRLLIVVIQNIFLVGIETKGSKRYLNQVGPVRHGEYEMTARWKWCANSSLMVVVVPLPPLYQVSLVTTKFDDFTRTFRCDSYHKLPMDMDSTTNTKKPKWVLSLQFFWNRKYRWYSQFWCH